MMDGWMTRQMDRYDDDYTDMIQQDTQIDIDRPHDWMDGSLEIGQGQVDMEIMKSR